MNTVRFLTGSIVVAAILLAACGPHISDTGYTGTWSRRGSDTDTTIEIAEVDGEYLFRWGRDSDDGQVKVCCEWDGSCEETFNDELIANYQMRTWVDDDSGHLFVECLGKRKDPRLGWIDVNYVDELVVKNQGRRLVSRVRGKDGMRFEGRGHGRRDFHKVSDSVVDPPPGSSDR